MRHMPVLLVIIPLTQAFLFPLARVFDEYVHKSPRTRLFAGGKTLLAVMLGLETFLTWYLIVNFRGPFTYALGDWPPALGISLHVDELALWFLGLANLGAVVVTLYSFNHIEHNEMNYYTLLGILRGGTAGLLLSGDLFNIFIFMELISIAGTALISFHPDPKALWGGFKYLMVSSIGGLLVLLGIVLLYGEHGHLNIYVLSGLLPEAGPGTFWAFALLLLGGMVKIAFFPFHLWLPPAHGEAELPVSALLSGVLLKVNFYVLLRIFSYIFPAGQDMFTPVWLWLSVFSIIAGHTGALRASRPKHILAYSSIVNMGYAGLAFGVAGPENLFGALALLGQHFIGKTYAFLGIGHFAKEKSGFMSRVFQGVFLLSILSLAGIPPLPGFWGKWLLLRDSFAAGAGWPGVIVLVSIGPSIFYYRRFFHLAAEPAGRQPAGWGKTLCMLAFIPFLLLFYYLFFVVYRVF